MSKAHDTVFTPYATGEDVSYLFGITAAVDEDNVFSSTSIPSLAKQILSRPVEVFPGFTNDGSKTIFESATVDVPSSPVSTILSILEDVTLDTIPEDDLWQHADLDTRPSKKTNTWESFGASRDNFDIKVNPFLTEQRPQVFDELLRRHLNHIHAPNESGTVVDERLFREVRPPAANLITVPSCLLPWTRISIVPVETGSGFRINLRERESLGYHASSLQIVCPFQNFIDIELRHKCVDVVLYSAA